MMNVGCPVSLAVARLRLFLAQSCGKCVPCREGLRQLLEMLERLADYEGFGEAPVSPDEIEKLAKAVYDSADCAIGFEAAKMVLDSLAEHRADYVSHAEKGLCTMEPAKVPCQAGCPAHVNVPGYIALAGAGRYADAVRVIREENPFPSACGLICEHPCEKACRRNLVDDAVNIRGLKRFAVEKAGEVPPPKSAPKNGKRVGVVGGGPAGLTAAYYLSLAGFDVTVFEQREKLGGMLRYGIPMYRLPDADLDRDINAILATGVTVKTGVSVGKDISFADFRKGFDAVYLTIGAHGAKSLRLEGEDADGVLSAVSLLRNPKSFDLAGKRVVVVGGGNVAMDATRTARRLGAATVTCVYRRRIVDMTALPDEVAGAQAEGCEIVQLKAPVRIAAENGRVVGLVVQPQIVGEIKNGRPAPVNANAPEETIPCDVVIGAIGQKVDATGLDLTVGDGVFVGGDCDYGPATVVRAIAAGKEAAKKIATDLGIVDCGLRISEGVEIPAPVIPRLHWGRVNFEERAAADRRGDFELMERRMTDEEAAQECTRCLRCDKCGYGAVGK